MVGGTCEVEAACGLGMGGASGTVEVGAACGVDGEKAGGASMPASRRWAGVMGWECQMSGSRPEAALGKAITSRMLGRTVPGATPRWAVRDAGGPACPGPRAPPPGRSRRGPCAGRSRNACGRRENACRNAGPGRGACVGQNKNKVPSMYEMQGTLPGLAAPGRPVAWLSLYRARRPPEYRSPREAQVSLLLPRPGVASGQCPFLTVKAFLLPRLGCAQDPRRIFSEFLSCPHAVHRMWLVIRIQSRFSTAFCTGHPQITGRDPKNTGWPARRPRRISAGF